MTVLATVSCAYWMKPKPLCWRRVTRDEGVASRKGPGNIKINSDAQGRAESGMVKSKPMNVTIGAEGEDRTKHSSKSVQRLSLYFYAVQDAILPLANLQKLRKLWGHG